MSEKKLHKFALLDKKGKNRGTAKAEKMADARQIFSSNRLHFGMDPKLPTGWTIVDRGPVEEPVKVNIHPPTKAAKVAKALTDAGHPATAQPSPSRAFKVGDRVESLDGAGTADVGDLGTVAEIGGEYPLRIEWDKAPHRKCWFTPGSYHLFRLLTPAPEPKAEDLLAEIELLRGERNLAREGKEWAESEVERLKAELAEEKSEHQNAMDSWSIANARAEAAEAKLADLQAIQRVRQMVNDTYAETQDWTFAQLVDKVLAA